MNKLVHFIVGFIGAWIIILSFGCFITWGLNTLDVGSWTGNERFAALIFSFTVGCVLMVLCDDLKLNWKFQKK